MGKQHELLAVEKIKSDQANRLMQETINKFGKYEYFQGHIKTLKMLEDSPQNQSLENAAAENKNMPTTVQETLEYFMPVWATAEDVIFQKNKTNQVANADLMFRGQIIAEKVPVDELLGLESRLEKIRALMAAMPTVVASVKWEKDVNSGRAGAWVATDAEKTTKTEKTMVPVVLAEATDKHPAQVRESSVDKVVGMFTKINYSGAATSAQKAEVLSRIDDLIAEVKQARMRANSVETVTDRIGSVITNLIMQPFAA